MSVNLKMGIDPGEQRMQRRLFLNVKRENRAKLKKTIKILEHPVQELNLN
jgi:hypothetical protein